MMKLFNYLLAFFVCLAALMPARAETSTSVHYRIHIEQPTQHLAQIEARFPAQAADELIVQMPAWRSGRYQIQNLANGIRKFQARSSDGLVLNSEKIDKSSWRISAVAGREIHVSYELYADDLGGRVRHIDDSHAFLDASGVLVYNALQRALPVQVELQVPGAWISRSGMARCGEHCFVSPNYDELIDAPIETGVHEFRQFDVDGRRYELALWGRGNADIDQIAGDLQRIIPSTTAMFTAVPFQRYLFIVHQTDAASGATEHTNSTVIQKPRFSFAPRKDYLNFLRTAAHEFFHTWNVKAYRPKELVPYDFQQENYSPLLWFAEGSTAYYDELLSLRAGVQTREEFLEQVAKMLDEYAHTPGRLVMSASEASFDEWIAVNGERAKNASVNIYRKGEMLSLALDLMLLEQTRGRYRLDDVHRQLMQQHRVAQGGFGEQDVLNILRQLSGQDYSQWWQQYVRGTAELPLRELLAKAGLELRNEAAKELEPRDEKWTGITLKEDHDKEKLSVIESVEQGSPAWQAGLIGGDVIVALDKLRVNPKEFADRIALHKSDTLLVSYFRRSELQEARMPLLTRAKGKLKLLPTATVRRVDKLLYQQWLGLEWKD